MDAAGGITEYIDVAQVTLYAFWIFFFGLIFYLRREDRREGYPLEHNPGEPENPGVIWIPPPKVFRLADGSERLAPRAGETDAGRSLNARPIELWHGAPLAPVGDPMKAEVGPGAYALRDDVPDMTFHNTPKIVPGRVASEFSVVDDDPDPRGMQIIAADGRVAGVCADIWIDRGEAIIRYLEAETKGGRRVLIPMTLARVGALFGGALDLVIGDAFGIDGKIKVQTLTASQFEDIPALANPDQVTRLEEDRICAYFAGGQMYATPDRSEPIV